MAVLLKTASVRVSSIQIMQVRVQNKGKSVWKSRYVGDVSLTPPRTPQRNGVSECRNRTLFNMVRSMMYLTNLPLLFWGYALETSVFTLNRAPSKNPLRRHHMNCGLARNISCCFLKFGVAMLM